MAKKRFRHPLLDDIYEWIFSHKKYFFFAAVAIVLFAIFTEQMTALLIMVVFGFASAITSTYKRVVRLPPALELISLTTALVVVFYGPVVGIIYTIVVNMFAEVFSGYPDVMSLTYLPSRAIQALFVYFAVGSLGFVAAGIWGVIVFNLVQQPMFMYLTDAEKRLKAVYFVLLNVPLNIILFNFLGMPLFTLMGNIA